eukprot:jgi/Undpi1/9087/HiC_scaffold_26.g11547.m1
MPVGQRLAASAESKKLILLSSPSTGKEPTLCVGSSTKASFGEMADNGNYIEPEEIAVRHGVCGDPRQHQDESWNWYATPNEQWEVKNNATQGGTIEIKVAMSAYHWGHLEFFVCNTADLPNPEKDVVTQECFNKYPLTRAAGDDVNSPIDPNYSGRYYCDPKCREFETDQTKHIKSDGGYIMTMNYQLPADLTCDHCVLQMVYFTGHKCYHPGYKEFNPPSWPGSCAPNKEDWVLLTDEVNYCGDSIWDYAEEFWGCSDFSISAGDWRSNCYPSPPSPHPRPRYPRGTSVCCVRLRFLFLSNLGVQCGGDDYTGSTCCVEDYVCEALTDCYSQCRPIKI